MPDQPHNFNYRIRGFSATSDHDQKANRPTSATEQNLDPKQLMGQVFRSMRRPHFTDVLYHFDGLDRLARHWPTFSYLFPRRKHVAIKAVPLHLAPYLSWGPPYDEEGLAEKMLQAHDEQETQQKMIQHLLQCVDEGKSPELQECPLAMAFAGHLFGGSAWFHSQRERLREMVLQSPEASFVALSSGAFVLETEALLERIATDPRLVLELAQAPVHRQQLNQSWLGEALQPHPLFHALWRFTTGEESLAFHLLLQAAESEPLAAGVCLGLGVMNDRAARWIELALTSDEALYWMGKIWWEQHDDMKSFSYALVAEDRLAKNDRWNYHWLRDLEWDDYRFKATSLWPSPWAVEFIVDRHLSTDFVGDLCNERKLDHTHPIESAVLLWAADYVTP